MIKQIERELCILDGDLNGFNICTKENKLGMKIYMFYACCWLFKEIYLKMYFTLGLRCALKSFYT